MPGGETGILRQRRIRRRSSAMPYCRRRTPPLRYPGFLFAVWPPPSSSAALRRTGRRTTTRHFSHCKKWRRDWDLNPGYLAVYTLSRRAPSTTRTSLRLLTSLLLCRSPAKAGRPIAFSEAPPKAVTLGSPPLLAEGSLRNNISIIVAVASLRLLIMVDG